MAQIHDDKQHLRQLIGRFGEDGPIAAGCRHATLVSIAGRLRWEGYDVDTMRPVLHQLTERQCVPPLAWSDVERIVRNIARKPTGNGADAVSREIFERCRARVLQLRELSLRVPWRGRSASTDLAVFHALCSIAADCGRIEVQASLRQIAERAGIESFRTAARAANRLRHRGWLKPVQRGSYSIKRQSGNELMTTSSIWRLTRPQRLLHTDHINAASCASLNVLSCNSDVAAGENLNVLSCNTMTADVWRRAGFGLTARRLWQALRSDRTATAAELARQLGCHRSTITRLLSGKLKDYVVRKGRAWRKNGQDPPLTFDRMRRQRQEHANDRERFSDVLDFLRRRQRGGKLMMTEPLSSPVFWLLVTVQTAEARKVAVWLIALRITARDNEEAVTLAMPEATL